MKKKILLVDDEVDFLTIIRSSLVASGFQVTAANSGFQAQEFLNSEAFDLVISDFKMPNLNGMQLFEWTQQNKPVPFLLMTGFSDITTTEKARERGLSGFLSKPFKLRDLLDSIQEIFANQQNTDTSIEHEFTRIPIDNFINNQEIPYRVYLRMGDNRFLKIAHSGEDLDEMRLLKYKSSGVTHLFLRNDDFKAFIAFHLSMGKSLVASSHSAEKKEAYIRSLGETIFEKVFIEGLDENLFDYAKGIVGLSVKTILENDQVLSILEQLRNSKSIYTHSLSVSMFSVMVANKVGFGSVVDQFKLALAGLFHDIGKRELGLKIPDAAQITSAQKEILGGHPIEGMKILRSIEAIPEEIYQIVMHHEDCYGTGQWQKNTKPGMLHLAHIVAVTNKFCTVYEAGSSQGITPYQALYRVKSEEYIDGNIYRAFLDTFDLSYAKKQSS